MSIVRPYRFGNIVRKKVKVGFPTDLVPPHMVAVFVFAVHQDVAKFEILNKDDGGCVIEDVLQPLVAGAKRLFRPLTPANLGQ
jgi:hypothetical protein